MNTLLLCVVLVLTAGLVSIYRRLSPLQAFQDERIWLQQAHEGRRKAQSDEDEALLTRLRAQVNELLETIRHERSTTEMLRNLHYEQRTTSKTLIDQLHAECFASEARCEEINAERLDLFNILYSELAPKRVEMAVMALDESRKKRGAEKLARVQEKTPPALAQEEQTKREGVPALPASPGNPRAAHAEPAHVHAERAAKLPTTPEAVARQSRLVAATAAGEGDVEGNEATRAWSSTAFAQALHGDPGAAEVDDTAKTQTLSKADLPAALEAGAGGATRPPQTATRAVRPGAVAPPASASQPLLATPARKAVGVVEKPRSAPALPPPAAPPQRTATMVGLPAMRPPPPDGSPRTERSPGSTVKHDRGDLHHSTSERGARLASSTSASSPTPAADDAERDTIDSLPGFLLNDLSAPENAPAKAPALEVPLYAPRTASTSRTAEARYGLDGFPEAVPQRAAGAHDETPGKPRAIEHEARK